MTRAGGATPPEPAWQPPAPAPASTRARGADFFTWWPPTIGFVAISVVLIVYVPSVLRIVGMQGLIPVGVVLAITLVLLALAVSRTLEALRAGGPRTTEAAEASVRSVVGVPPAPSPPIPAAGASEPEQTRGSRIKPTADGGTAFEFPPSRGSAGVLTAVLLLSIGLLALFVAVVSVRSRGMASLALIWAIIDYVLLLAVLRLCFVTDRVVIGREWISVTAGLLGGTRRMRRDGVRTIRAAAGLLTLHHSIRICGTGWRRITVADGIRDWREAEALAARMSRLAGVAETPARPEQR
jgi:hypothetical protein